jgi:hypothetical protein
MRSPTAAPVPSLHLLPLELRREIYGYVALDEESWIGVPSALDARLARLASENAKESHLGENMSLNEFVRRYVTGCLEDEQTHRPRPTALVKTTSGLVETCSQIRNEFREAVWWNCVDNLHLDENVEVLVRNFCVEDFKAFMHSLSIREMMRLSEKRREPNRNKLRIHLDLSRTFPLWTPSIETPDFLVANIVCVGNVLAALLERVGLAAITPRRLLELRDIAQKARKWKCNMKTAVMVRGAYAIQEPIREWMAFVRSTGLRADYVVDTPTPREKMEGFEHAMRDKRLYARDEAWRSVFNAVVKSCGRESAYDWVCLMGFFGVVLRPPGEGRVEGFWGSFLLTCLRRE